MSKRRKRNRQDKLPKSAVAQRRLPEVAVIILAVAVVVSLEFWWWNSQFGDMLPAAKPITESSTTSPVPATSQPDFLKLKGRWRRPDGGYILAIKSIADSGTMDAGYFNPNPIHVAKAAASQDGGVTKVFVELRDVNYPGSTYTLTYEPASNWLKGIYYQAVEHQRFEVVFVRIK